MIDKTWIRTETTVEEIEKITIVELEGLDPANVVEKGNWWTESIYKRDPLWQQFKAQLQPGDRIHRWWGPRTLFPMTGYVIVRDGDPVYNVHEFTEVD